MTPPPSPTSVFLNVGPVLDENRTRAIVGRARPSDAIDPQPVMRSLEFLHRTFAAECYFAGHNFLF